MNPISVCLMNLGKVSYIHAYEIMKSIELLHFEKNNSGIKNSLILTEHPPTYTIGTRDKTYINFDKGDFLKSLGAEYIPTDRGGLITFHGPGQVVAYPILNLRDFSLTPREYVYHLEDWLIQICKAFNVYANRTSDIGVWVNNNKIGALGVHVRNKFITSHGIALNCNIDLQWFSHIVPCGLAGKGTTSLSKETSRDITCEETLNVLLDNFQKIFNVKFEESN